MISVGDDGNVRDRKRLVRVASGKSEGRCLHRIASHLQDATEEKRGWGVPLSLLVRVTKRVHLLLYRDVAEPLLVADLLRQIMEDGRWNSKEAIYPIFNPNRGGIEEILENTATNGVKGVVDQLRVEPALEVHTDR